MMQTRSRLIWIVAAMALNLALNAQEKISKNEKTAMDDMMKKWTEAATPGEAHKKLNVLVGTWDVTSQFWMEGPDKAPMTTKGKAEYKWILGGRFLQEDFSGEMMGKPYNGIGLFGYDNMNKKYTSLWIDNTSTAMYTGEGTSDATGTVFTYFGKTDEPMTGEHDKTVMYVWRLISGEKHIFEFHDFSYPQGKTKTGEMIYTREKGKTDVKDDLMKVKEDKKTK
jgi:hypothetical protein